MRTLVFILCMLPHCASAALQVDFGRFEVDQGSKNVNDVAAVGVVTNYFSVRPESTNYIHVQSHASAWTLASGVNVRYDWFGNSSAFTTTTNFARDVVALSPGSGQMVFNLTNLWPGSYCMRIFGTVTNEHTNTWRLPLVWKIVESTASKTNVRHSIANWITNKVYDVGNIWAQAIDYPGPTNTVSITLSLDPVSMVNVHVVSVHFEMPIDWSDTSVGKTLPTTYTTAENQSRTNYAQTNAVAGTVLNWKNNSPSITSNALTASERTNAFRRWPPLGTMGDESLGATFTPLGASSTQWFAAPYQVNSQLYKSAYLSPWGKTNIVTGQSFAYEDFIAGNSLPGDTNDFIGFKYTNGVWGSSWGVPSYQTDLNLITTMFRNSESSSLPYRYWTFPGQTNVARIAGFIMGNLSQIYPTYRLESFDISPNIANPSAYLSYDLGRWTLRRTGKYAYDGHAGTWQNELSQAVDWIWPYIAADQKFATDLTEQVPWIDGSTNNVQRLFYGLLRSMAVDSTLHARTGDPMLLGLVMQSGTVASNLMNPAVATLDIDPGGNYSWKKHYASSFSVNGGNFIGSIYYMTVENYLINGPDYTRRYTNAGGTLGAINIADSTKFSKLAAFVDWYASQQTAYNFQPSYGDAAMSINEGPGLEVGTSDAFLIGLWRLKNNSRLAKHIVSRGRTTQDDTEWSAMQAQAAAESGNIGLATESRIFQGTGIGILEGGLDYTNQVRRRSVVVRAGVGAGHDHGDHLDLNLYGLGSRIGTDFAQRNEGSLLVYPNDTATKVHNVVEVDGYGHPTSSGDGWPGGTSDGGVSYFTGFSTSGVAQVLFAEMQYPTAKTNTSYHRRDVAFISVDATNSYVIDFQRVNGGRFHSWSFHGADVGGESNSFVASVGMTNVTLDLANTAAMNISYWQRKNATNSAYPITAGPSSNKVWAEWRLGRTATSAGSLKTGDNVGGTVTAIAPEQEMWGYSYSAGDPRTYSRATLFDRTNDVVSSAWSFSPAYSILQPRLYVATTNAGQGGSTNFSNTAGTWAALYDGYRGSRWISSERSVAVSGGTGAFVPKVIEVISPSYTDTHYSGVSNAVLTAETSGWAGDYGFVRKSGANFVAAKLIGGTALTNGSFWMTVSTNRVSASIVSVDYTNRTFVIDTPMPVRRAGWYRIYNSTHEASYYVTAWSTATNATFLGDPIVGEMDVATVSGNALTMSNINGGLVMATYPKRGTGITAQNESRSKTLKGTYAGVTTFTRASGDTVVRGDFTDVDGDGLQSIWFYDFGPGDTLEVPSEVSITDNSNGTYTVSANVAFTSSALGSITAADLTGQDQTFMSFTPTAAIIGPARPRRILSR